MESPPTAPLVMVQAQIILTAFEVLLDLPCSKPRRSRAFKTAHAPLRTSGAGWCRVTPTIGVPWCRATLDFFDSFTGSPQALSTTSSVIGPTGFAESGRAVLRRHIMWPSATSSRRPLAARTPCRSRLFTQRPKTAYVFTAAPGILFLPSRAIRQNTRSFPCFRYYVPSAARSKTVNINEFISKWRKVELKERSAAQEHFIDLCRLLNHPTDTEGSSA